MKQNRLGLATAALIVLGGLTVWRLSARDAEDKPPPDKAEVKLPKLKRDQIDELELAAPEREKVRIVKKGDEWRIAEPLDARADQDAVSTTLTKLEELEVTGTAATKSKNHDRLEVDEKKGTHVVAKGGGKVLLDGYVGVYQAGNTMFRLQGQEPVATVKSSIRYAFNKHLREWRDRTITKVETASIQEMVFENKNGRFHFVRDGEEWKQVPGKGQKPITPLDPSKVKGVAGTTATVNATDFAEPGVSAEQAGLGAGAATASIKLGGDAGAQQILYRIGNEKDKNFYLQREGSDTIYVVSAFIGGRLIPNADAFMKKEPEKMPEGHALGSPGNPIQVPPIRREMMPPPGHPPPSPHGH